MRKAVTCSAARGMSDRLSAAQTSCVRVRGRGRNRGRFRGRVVTVCDGLRRVLRAEAEHHAARPQREQPRL
eukprot:scaffold55865_cov61-Phaeocystis_antarctica.AAC.11